jgi:hypothetical protein
MIHKKTHGTKTQKLWKEIPNFLQWLEGQNSGVSQVQENGYIAVKCHGQQCS